MTRLVAGTGSSTLDVATAAGHAAVASALSALAARSDEPPALAVVFVSVRYDVTEIVAAVRAALPGVPLVGASSSGQFHNGELLVPGAGVTVVVATAGPYRFGTASVTGLQADPFAAGRSLARAAREAAGPQPTPHAAVVLLSADGFVSDLQQLLNGLHRVAGAAVPVIGGSASDDRRLERTWVVHGDQVLTDAAVALWIGSETPLRVGSGHGWQPISPPMMVTHTNAHAVEQIGGRPAVDVFREHVSADAEPKDVAGAPDMRPGGWHSAHAFGLIEPDGSQLIRGAYIDPEDVLRTFIPFPPYAAVQVVSSGPDAVLDVPDSLVPEVVGDTEPGLLLAFDCVARLDILADRAAEEPARIQAAAGTVPTAGFYTYGEFARSVGVGGVHNATLALIAL